MVLLIINNRKIAVYVKNNYTNILKYLQMQNITRNII